MDIIVFIVLLLVVCIIISTCFFGLRKFRAKIASQSSAHAAHDQMATSLEEPLLVSTGSINDSESSSSMAAVVNSMEAGHFSAAADPTPSPRPPSQKKKARADPSHLASARIDPADLSPFLDETTDDPILLGRGGFGAVSLRISTPTTTSSPSR